MWWPLRNTIKSLNGGGLAARQRFMGPSTSWMMMTVLLLSSSFGSKAFGSSHYSYSMQQQQQQQDYSSSFLCSQKHRLPGQPLLQAQQGGGSDDPASSEDETPSPSVNGNNNGNSNNPQQQQEQDDKVGRTGWNHNPPDASSNFWIERGNLGQKFYEPWAAKNSNNNNVNNNVNVNNNNDSNNNKEEEARTGWLHYSKAESRTTTTPTTTASSSSLSLARERLNRAMLESVRNHRIVAPVAFHTTSTQQQVLAVTEHVISVPLQYDHTENAERIDVYFTITEKVASEEQHDWLHSLTTLSPTQRAQKYLHKAALPDLSKACLYLQGGPGFGAAAPVAGLGMGSAQSSWAAQALLGCQYERIVLLDQRGTGRSSPITKQTLEHKFPDLFLMDEENKDSAAAEGDQEDAATQQQRVDQAVQAATNYLALFRADNIVRDAEFIRDALIQLPPLGETTAADEKSAESTPQKKDPKPWGACLGQSFGGFCLMTYLSQVAHPPKICLFTGGIAPILEDVYSVYQRLWKRVQKRSLLYYEMYPGDVRLVKRICQRLLWEPVLLPTGGSLSARRFLQIGLNYLGSSPSAFCGLHQLLHSALVNPDATDIGELEFHRSFLKTVEMAQSFDDAPLYYWLHESIYADAGHNSPTQWAAHRAYQDLVRQEPQIWDYRETSKSLDNDDVPTLFFGEMVFPWMADGEYSQLGGYGLKRMAQALAEKDDWPALFDTTKLKTVLHEGTSKAAAAVYYDDFYVDFDCCRQVFEGPMDKAKVYITNEYQHSGLRDDGASIFLKLHGMATGATRIPS